MRMEHLGINHLLRASPFSTVIMEIKFQNEFWRGHASKIMPLPWVSIFAAVDVQDNEKGLRTELTIKKNETEK